MHFLFYPAILLLPLGVFLPFSHVPGVGAVFAVAGAWASVCWFLFQVSVFLLEKRKAAVDDILHATGLVTDTHEDVLHSKIAAYRKILYGAILKIDHLLQMQNCVWIRLAQSISFSTDMQGKRTFCEACKMLQRIICSGCLSWIRFEDERNGPVELWNQMPMSQNQSRSIRMRLLRQYLSTSNRDEEARCEEELRRIYTHDMNEGRVERRFARHALLNAITRGPPTDYEANSPVIECSDLESMFLSVLNDVLQVDGAHHDSDEYVSLVDTINTLRFDSDRDVAWLENAGEHVRWSREREKEALEKIRMRKVISLTDDLDPNENETRRLLG